jgi:hypothetical protein
MLNTWHREENSASGGNRDHQRRPNSTAPDTIFLVHGFWVTPLSWEKWVESYEGRGYNVLTPTYPGFEGGVEALREDKRPPRLPASPRPRTDARRAPGRLAARPASPALPGSSAYLAILDPIRSPIGHHSFAKGQLSLHLVGY